MIERVEAYLAEGGMRRLARSNLLRAVRFAPAALGAPVGNAQDMAENMLDHPHFEQQPLAYLAFASHEFARTATYQSAPGQLSLADSMLLPL
jgi:hypothetical protein